MKFNVKAVIAILVLLASTCLNQVLAQQAHQPTEPTPTTYAVIEPFKQKVVSLAKRGKLTDELVETFREYAVARAMQISASTPDLDENFWAWLSENEIFHKYLAISIYPSNNSNIFTRLQTLRKEFGTAVDTHPHLALAFAIYWARDKDWSIIGNRYPKARLQTIPPMLESFRYYLENESQMECALKNTPWQLLIYLAENYVPVSERLWVLNHYKNADAASIGKKATLDMKYGSVHWHRDNNPHDRPKTLQNLLKYGGFCGKRANYANGVCKALGVPSMRAGCPGHAWVVWLARAENGSLDLLEFPRYKSSYYGWLPRPDTGEGTYVGEVRFMLFGITQSYEKYMKALVGCYAYDLLPLENRKEALGIIKDSIDINSYCAPAWERLAQACADGYLSPGEEINALHFVLVSFPRFPHLSFKFLEKICESRITSNANSAEILASLRMFEKASSAYDQAIRPDLALKVRVLHGQYLKEAGQNSKAYKHYTDSIRHYTLEYPFKPETQSFEAFNTLWEEAKKLSSEKPDGWDWLNFLDSFAQELIRLKNPPHQSLKLHIIKEYVCALRNVGREREARIWAKLLPELLKKSPSQLEKLEKEVGRKVARECKQGQPSRYAVSLADMFGQSQFATVALAGSGFREAILQTGVKAFSNRTYSWEDVPDELTGWTFTMTAGGNRPHITVKAITSGLVVVAVCDDTETSIIKFIIAGWALNDSLSFHFKNGNRTMQVLYRYCKSGQTLSVPQLDWSGSIVLTPPGSAGP